MNSEKITKNILFAATIILILLAAGMVLTLVSGSVPVFKRFGFQFIYSSKWNPTAGREQYGALPFIVGTLVTSILAIVICLPLAFSTSLFIGEYYKGTLIAKIIGTLVDLLAGIPSIVYGLWGFYYLRPLIVTLGFNPGHHDYSLRLIHEYRNYFSGSQPSEGSSLFFRRNTHGGDL